MQSAFPIKQPPTLVEHGHCALCGLITHAVRMPKLIPAGSTHVLARPENCWLNAMPCLYISPAAQAQAQAPAGIVNYCSPSKHSTTHITLFFVPTNVLSVYRCTSELPNATHAVSSIASATILIAMAQGHHHLLPPSLTKLASHTANCEGMRVLKRTAHLIIHLPHAAVVQPRSTHYGRANVPYRAFRCRRRGARRAGRCPAQSCTGTQRRRRWRWSRRRSQSSRRPARSGGPTRRRTAARR